MYGLHSKYRFKLSQLFNFGNGKQSTHLNCIIYPEERNGTILLTHKACTKQLATPPSYYGTNNYTNPWSPKG